MLQDQLDKLLQSILRAHEDGMDCETCNSEFECLAEQVAAGGDIHALLPAVEAHLVCCADCREEFEALVSILRAENGGFTSQLTDK
jgi:hypothetical protein